MFMSCKHFGDDEDMQLSAPSSVLGPHILVQGNVMLQCSAHDI